jgi:hypothetical protein
MVAGHAPFEPLRPLFLSLNIPQQGVQVLDVAGLQLNSVGQLQYGHWLATVTRLPNGMVTVMSDSPSPVGPTRKDGVQVRLPSRADQPGTSMIAHGHGRS